MIEEEKEKPNGEAEYDAVASLATDKANISFDDLIRMEQIMQCWKDAGKLISFKSSTFSDKSQESSIVFERKPGKR